MNKWCGMGRLTSDPKIYLSNVGGKPLSVARYTLAVPKVYSEGANYVQCVAFGKRAEFAEQYLKQGIRIAVVGRIETGSYTNKEGTKIYTTEIVVDEQEFADGKKDSPSSNPKPITKSDGEQHLASAESIPVSDDDGFVPVSDGFDLPFDL